MILSLRQEDFFKLLLFLFILVILYTEGLNKHKKDWTELNLSKPKRANNKR